MKMLPLENDDGVNILLEYLFSLTVMVILFSLMVMTIGSIMNNTDRIVLKEEFDIVSNDLSNRITAFSDEILMTQQTGMNVSSTVDDHTAYFDLPELVSGKQYVVEITYDDSLKAGKVKVTYEGNTNVYSIATFNSTVKVKNGVKFYSQQGKYGLYYYPANNTIDVGNNA
jgi:hypothetical protein